MSDWVLGHCEVEWEGVDWVRMAEVRGLLRAVVNTVMNPRVP